MKKRIKKKMVRDGICPCCKSGNGIAHFDSTTYKRFMNVCTDCFTCSIINENGHIEYEVNEEFKKTWQEAEKQPMSPQMKKFLEKLEDNNGSSNDNNEDL